jgi:hypothetical protein
MRTSLVGAPVYHAKITASIKSQVWRDDKQSRYPAATVAIVILASSDSGASARPNPEAQAKGNHDHGTDAAKP